MTDAVHPIFERLAAENRLRKPAFNGATHVAGRSAYRGEILLSADPETILAEVIATAPQAAASLDFLSGKIAELRDLPALIDALGPALAAGGKYFIYAADVKRGDRMEVALGGVSLRILPYDDVSVYNELIDFLYLDKAKMKKYDTPAKIDAIADGVAGYDEAFPKFDYEAALAQV